MAIDKIGSAAITDSAVTDAKLSFNANQFRNIIINGDMSVAQRGTSATGLTNGDSGYHTCDRWNFREGGAPSFVFTQTQDTTVPTGQGFAKSLKMDCTTAQGSLAAGDNLRIDQRIEGQNVQYLKKGTSSAESLTLSFWVYATKTGTNIIELYDNDNARSISKSYTISSSETWEKKTITIEGDTTGALDNDSSQSLRFMFFLAAGSNFTSGTLQTSWGSQVAANRAVGQVNHADSTSNDFIITGVQLEVGTTASDFEFLPHEINGFRCCRYYQQVGLDMYQYRYMPSTAQNWSGGAHLGTLAINFPMRANPTTITSGSWTGAGHSATDNNCTPGSLTSIGGGFNTMHRFSWTANQNSSALGKGVQFYTNGDTPDLAFDAEL